jgi:hypothetical protein
VDAGCGREGKGEGAVAERGLERRGVPTGGGWRGRGAATREAARFLGGGGGSGDWEGGGSGGFGGWKKCNLALYHVENPNLGLRLGVVLTDLS